MASTATESFWPVDRSPDAVWNRRFHTVALSCLAVASLVGVGAAIGSVLGVGWLAAGPAVWGVRPAPVPSIIAALVVCSGLWFALFGGPRLVTWGRVALVLAAASGLGWLITTLWVRIVPIAIDPTGPQVPASSAAFGLAAVAASGVLVSTRRGTAAGQVVALLAGTIATVPILGYLLGDRLLAGFPFGFGEIAVPTSIVVVLAAASSAFARPGSGLIDVAASRSPGGTLLRRLVLPVLLLPPVLIVAISAGEHRPVRTLAWVGSVLSSIGLVSLVATARTLDRADAARRRATEQAIALAAGLIQDAEVVAEIGESLGMIGALPEGVAAAARRTPAEGVVGGDAYALVDIRGMRLGVVLVDIASKGARPAPAAVRLRDILAAALASGASPARAISSAMWLVREAGITATAFVGIVDPMHDTLTYAGAGHVPAFHRFGDSIDVMERTGPLLDAGVEHAWVDSRRVFGPGASLLAYSDGIADVVVRSGGGTSVEHLRAMLTECPDGTPEHVVEWFIARLESSPEWAVHDDATLIVVRRLAGDGLGDDGEGASAGARGREDMPPDARADPRGAPGPVTPRR